MDPVRPCYTMTEQLVLDVAYDRGPYLPSLYKIRLSLTCLGKYWLLLRECLYRASEQLMLEEVIIKN